jgi:hypothetical protein
MSFGTLGADTSSGDVNEHVTNATSKSMKTHETSFDEHAVLHELKHFLPAQAPLKDFIHHNTLHAFQTLKFHDGLRKASEILGYKVLFR